MKTKHSNWLVAPLLLIAFHTHGQFDKHIKKPKVAAVPIITYNKSYGGIFGAFGALYFPINKKDTLSPASCAGAGGIISTNKTWFGFGFAKLYYSKDLFRTVVAGGTGNQNFQYYNENYGMSGSFISYSSLLNFFYGEQLVRVYGRLYTGRHSLFSMLKRHLKQMLQKLQHATISHWAFRLHSTPATIQIIHQPAGILMHVLIVSMKHSGVLQSTRRWI